MDKLAAVLQVVGLVAMTIGAALLAPWFAFLLGGAGALAMGVAIERGDR